MNAPQTLDVALDREFLSPGGRSSRFPTPTNPNPWVSEYSRWKDPRWKFTPLTAGSEGGVLMSWDMVLADGFNLMDDDHALLLNEMRHLALSCLVDPRGYRHKLTSAGVISNSVRKLAAWMIRYHYDSISQLDAEAFQEQMDDALHQFKGAEDEESEELLQLAKDEEVEAEHSGDIDDDLGISVGYLWSCFKAWKLIWEQRMALADLGIVVTMTPFHSKGLHKLARDLATVAIGRIPPVPDLVAVEVLNTAHSFFVTYGDKLVEYSRLAASAYLDPLLNEEQIAARIKSRGILDSIPSRFKMQPEIGIKPISNLVGASVTMLQAESAMRINELVALPGGWNPETGLPACLEVKDSISGTLELYYLRSPLSKMKRRPEEKKWLLAARLKGTTEIPAVVQVVILLHQLFEPWRSTEDDPLDNRLIVKFAAKGKAGRQFFPRHLPALERIKRSKSVFDMCQDFIKRHVDLSQLPDLPDLQEYKETQGACITSHQWRKTYARFVYQVDGRLLPAIARQFKHISLAMTEGAYVGTDIKVFHEVAEHNKNKAVDLLLEFARGEATPYEGRLAKLIGNYQAELAGIVAGISDLEAYELLGHWVSERGMKMFNHGYGGCIPAIAPTEAECHKKAGTSHWANHEPNYRFRGASTCTGCFLFIAGPETVDYWTERFVTNMTAWAEAKKIGREKEYRINLERASQSEKYLKTLGAKVPVIPILEVSNGR